MFAIINSDKQLRVLLHQALASTQGDDACKIALIEINGKK